MEGSTFALLSGALVAGSKASCHRKKNYYSDGLVLKAYQYVAMASMLMDINALLLVYLKIL